MAVLVLFGLSTVSGLLGVLLTFARTPWYPAYADDHRGLGPRRRSTTSSWPA